MTLIQWLSTPASAHKTFDRNNQTQPQYLQGVKSHPQVISQNNHGGKEQNSSQDNCLLKDLLFSHEIIEHARKKKTTAYKLLNGHD